MAANQKPATHFWKYWGEIWFGGFWKLPQLLKISFSINVHFWNAAYKPHPTYQSLGGQSGAHSPLWLRPWLQTAFLSVGVQPEVNFWLGPCEKWVCAGHKVQHTCYNTKWKNNNLLHFCFQVKPIYYYITSITKSITQTNNLLGWQQNHEIKLAFLHISCCFACLDFIQQTTTKFR